MKLCSRRHEQVCFEESDCPVCMVIDEVDDLTKKLASAQREVAELKESSIKPETRKQLGWANGWEEEPEIVIKCQAAGHIRSDIDIGPPHRGINNKVTCDICNYEYHYDSSD